MKLVWQINHTGVGLQDNACFAAHRELLEAALKHGRSHHVGSARAVRQPEVTRKNNASPILSLSSFSCSLELEEAILAFEERTRF